MESVNPENLEETFNAISAEYYIHCVLQKYTSAELLNKIKLLNALFNASLHTPGVITTIESCKTIQEILIYLRPKKGGNLFKNPNKDQQPSNNNDPSNPSNLINKNATDPISYIDIRIKAIGELYFQVKNASHALYLLRYLVFFPEAYDSNPLTFQANIESFVKQYKKYILSRESVDDILHKQFVPTILWHSEFI